MPLSGLHLGRFARLHVPLGSSCAHPVLRSCINYLHAMISAQKALTKLSEQQYVDNTYLIPWRVAEMRRIAGFGDTSLLLGACNTST